MQSGHFVLPFPLWITQLQIQPRSKIWPHGFTVAGAVIGSVQITQSSAGGVVGVWVGSEGMGEEEAEGIVSQELFEERMSSIG